jgi:hypothetical protein
VNVIDIHPYSLTDPHLTGKRFDVDYLVAKDPAWIVTTAHDDRDLPTMYPEEKKLLADPRVKDHYVRTAKARQHARRTYALWERADRVTAP